MQAPLSNIVIGSHVWVADKDLSWIDGEVFKIDGQNAHVRTTKGKTVCVHDLLTSLLLLDSSQLHRYRFLGTKPCNS